MQPQSLKMLSEPGTEVAGPPQSRRRLSGGPKPRSHGSHTRTFRTLPDEGLAGAPGAAFSSGREGAMGVSGPEAEQRGPGDASGKWVWGQQDPASVALSWTTLSSL